jgi:hypothetical protein
MGMIGIGGVMSTKKEGENIQGKAPICIDHERANYGLYL